MKVNLKRKLREYYDPDQPQVDTMRRVAEFHLKFGSKIAASPDLEDDGTNMLRMALLTEELQELGTALEERNYVEALDALTDLQYVLDGAYLALGFADLKGSAFLIVHGSNMSKAGEDGNAMYADNGKILKGPNYRPPELGCLLPHHREVASE